MTMDGTPPASGSLPQVPSPPSLIGEILDGRYRLVKKLGEGGMGEVYAAEHVHIEKRFAVKLLRPEIVSNKEAVTRFRQEARSASSIGHRNIIAIEDFGQLPDGRIYMCMELLNGAPLNELIKQPWPAERMINILIQTGHGLAAAHAKGIVHRDMKPENVFVTWTSGGEDIPKLLDFGIAKVAGNDGQNNLTRTGTIFGTPFYMAPEQALGTQVDHRTDIYAMGVIMYEIFSGSLPFQGESFMGILTQHITTDPESVVQRAARTGRTLPPGIADVIHRCMQKDPNLRFSTMDELVSALVNIYRAVAGAGMSSYMEAFPQNAPYPPPIAVSRLTPPQLTGPVIPVIGAGQAPYPPPYQSGGQAGVSAGYSGPGSAAPPRPPTGPHVGYGYDSAGSAVFPEKRSKVGLIFAIIAVLAVVGGAVAFIVIDSDRRGSQPGADAGARVDALVIAAGDAAAPPVDAALARVDAGVVADAAEISDAAAIPVVADAAMVADAALAPDAAVEPTEDAGSEPVSPKMIEVVVSVSPAEARLFDGRRQLSSLRVKFDPRRAKKLLVKAPGYRSKSVTLSGRDSRISVTLEKEAADPPKLDCVDRLVDAKSQACIDQYCKRHASAMECTE
jgi:serine/threonine protein kinase